jgi:hypothetical protein
MEDIYLSKIKRQGAGLHLYFTTEIIKNPKFPLKENDTIVISLNPDGIGIRKVDIKKL